MSTVKKVARKAPPQLIYQLRVSLNEIEPEVWRRLWVADTMNLAKFDRVIQAAMGWTNSHLHEFTIDGRTYGVPDPDWPSAVPVLREQAYTVGQVLGDSVKRFEYTYDLGDDWQHTVTVEKILRPDETNVRPVCLAGQNACPPEDVGSSSGYMDFVQAMRDPTHEEHVAMWRWHGGPFDPAGFDLNAANAAIRKLRI